MATKNIIKIISLFLMLAVLVLVTGCPSNDELYSVAKEEYLLGWVLHNIDDSTPTELNYEYDDLAIYNYSYNYPADNSNTYDNVQYWIAPFQTGAGSSWIRMGVPQDRVYYLKGDKVSEEIYGHGWSFANWMQINYLSSDSFARQFGLDVAHQEHYKSENAFHAIEPVPGAKEHIYFGTSPFTPVNVIIVNQDNEDFIKLNDHLLRGYGGKSYLTRSTRNTVSGGDEIIEIKLPIPTYKIYLNNNIINEGDLTDYYNYWDYRKLYNHLSTEGEYKVQIELSSGYPTFNKTVINTNFVYKENIELPILKHIEFPPRFKINEEIPITIEFENEGVINEVLISYKTDKMQNWQALNKNSLVIKNPKVQKIDFMFKAITKDGVASYEIYPISLKSLSISCKHIISKNTMLGTCTDETNNRVKGIIIELYEGDKHLGNTMTNSNGEYSFEIDSSIATVKVKFEGTGVYDAMTTTIAPTTTTTIAPTTTTTTIQPTCQGTDESCGYDAETGSCTNCATMDAILLRCNIWKTKVRGYYFICVDGECVTEGSISTVEDCDHYCENGECKCYPKDTKVNVFTRHKCCNGYYFKDNNRAGICRWRALWRGDACAWRRNGNPKKWYLKLREGTYCI